MGTTIRFINESLNGKKRPDLDTRLREVIREALKSLARRYSFLENEQRIEVFTTAIHEAVAPVIKEYLNDDRDRKLVKAIEETILGALTGWLQTLSADHDTLSELIQKLQKTLEEKMPDSMEAVADEIIYHLAKTKALVEDTRDSVKVIEEDIGYIPEVRAHRADSPPGRRLYGFSWDGIANDNVRRRDAERRVRNGVRHPWDTGGF